MRIILFLYLFFMMTGFLSPEQLQTQNRDNLTQLSVGMTKKAVIDRMGTEYAEDFDADGMYRINNPYTSEVILGKKDRFEVLYYQTSQQKRDRIIAENELTPVVFEKDKCIGWGWNFLHQIIEKYEISLGKTDTTG